MGVKLYKQLSKNRRSINKDVEPKINVQISYSTVDENSKELKEKYGFNEQDGSFGTHNKGSARVYNLVAENPDDVAFEFWSILSKGGDIEDRGNGLYIAKFDDGSVIAYREKTKSGPPAIDINMKRCKKRTKIKNHKIHFKKEDNK